MSYQRRVLSGSTPAPVRARNVEPAPAWVTALDDAELQAFEDIAHREEIARLQAEEEAEDAREAERVKLAALPKPPTRPSVKQRIIARRRWPAMWAKSASGEDFRQRLIENLLAMLAVARASHDAEGCDRIEGELRPIGQEPPEE